MKSSIVEYVKKHYSPQHHLVAVGGKLTGDWSNVADHCFVQCVAVETLADLLGLPEEDKICLARVATCHDWAKRLEKRPQDFTQQEKSRAQYLFKVAGPEQVLMDALSPAFLLRVQAGKAMFLELIQFLMDDMTMGDQIVSLDQRIAEVSVRNPNPAPEVEAQLGRSFWSMELDVGHEVEAVVYALLKVRRQPYDNIARLINSQLDKRFPE